VVVGESTFGKGTVQTVLDLSRFINDTEPVGELKLTFRILSCNRKQYATQSVSPDINLPSPFDAEHFGESSSPNALPWDVIRAASFQKVTQVNPQVLAGLNKAYSDRTRYDANLKKFITETDELKKNLNETRISLNETKRKQEMAEAERRKLLKS
jgi:carboxyl-terminal processing protease